MAMERNHHRKRGLKKKFFDTAPNGCSVNSAPFRTGIRETDPGGPKKPFDIIFPIY